MNKDNILLTCLLGITLIVLAFGLITMINDPSITGHSTWSFLRFIRNSEHRHAAHQYERGANRLGREALANARAEYTLQRKLSRIPIMQRTKEQFQTLRNARNRRAWTTKAANSRVKYAKEEYKQIEPNRWR